MISGYPFKGKMTFQNYRFIVPKQNVVRDKFTQIRFTDRQRTIDFLASNGTINIKADKAQ